MTLLPSALARRVVLGALLFSACTRAPGRAPMESPPMAFRFEDHSDEASANEALARVLPVGAPAGDVVQTLEAAGARCDRHSPTVIACRYVERGWFLVHATWSGVVTLDPEGRLASVAFRRGLTGP